MLVTGADGFMGSHLTDALVELGATVHAFVRATSSGALNNIGHLRDRLKVHFADLTDRTSVDYLVRELKASASDRPYIFHLGAQAHVGESWHRPYETVATNVLGTLNLLQSVVDAGLELEKFDTAGTSEEYGNVRESVSDQHDFDSEGGLILHERSPINPKSIYATAKVAADFLTMNYYDAFGVPGVVTRMFNNYGPRQNPRYVTGTIITQALTRDTVELGALDPLRDFCFCSDGVRGHLTVAAQGTPGDVYVYGQGENISMRDWVDLILRVGEAEGFWPAGREIVSSSSRHRPGSSEVMALRVGHEKLTAETGWQPRVSWEEGVLQTIRWYAENRGRWIGRVDWLSDRRPARDARLGPRADDSRDPVVAGLGEAGADVVALLRAPERHSSGWWHAPVRKPDDPRLVDAAVEGIPAREPERLEVVVVDVHASPVRPTRLEQSGDLRLEASGPERAVGAVGVHERRELQAGERDERCDEDADATIARDDSPSKRLERGDRDDDQHHGERGEAELMEAVGGRRGGDRRHQQGGDRVAPERIGPLPGKDENETGE